MLGIWNGSSIQAQSIAFSGGQKYKNRQHLLEQSNLKFDFVRRKTLIEAF